MIKQNTPWFLFWNSLNSEEKRLFRLLQSTYGELGKNSQMFCYGYLTVKNEIKKYAMEKFCVDLENLPKDK